MNQKTIYEKDVEHCDSNGMSGPFNEFGVKQYVHWSNNTLKRGGKHGVSEEDTERLWGCDFVREIVNSE